MRILVMKVNTSPTMTDVTGEAARRRASAGTETVALRHYFGAEAVERNVESYLSAVAVVDRVPCYDEPHDAVVLAGFGEHGRDEAITTEIGVPVVDGVGAAVRLAEAVAGLGLRTSKVSTYAPPEPKKIIGWPLSAALGLRGGFGDSRG